MERKTLQTARRLSQHLEDARYMRRQRELDLERLQYIEPQSPPDLERYRISTVDDETLAARPIVRVLDIVVPVLRLEDAPKRQLLHLRTQPEHRREPSSVRLVHYLQVQSPQCVPCLRLFCYTCPYRLCSLEELLDLTDGPELQLRVATREMSLSAVRSPMLFYRAYRLKFFSRHLIEETRCAPCAPAYVQNVSQEDLDRSATRTIRIQLITAYVVLGRIT